MFIGEGPNERFTASISDDGSFVFPGVPAGSYTITTDDPSIVPTVFPLIVASQDLEDVKVQVSSGVSVKGKVTDKGGKAISAAIRLRPSPANPVFEVDQPQGSVSAIYLAVSTPIPPQGIVPTLAEIRALLYQAAKTPSVIAGADGNFVFNKALPGTYTLTTTAIGQSFEREIQIGPEGLTQLDIQLPVTLIMGRFIAESGVPPPQLQGAIRFVNLGSDGKTTYGFPDADGNLSVLLPEGEFRLFTDNLNHPVRSITDGTRDLLNSPFVFDGATGHSLEIVVARE